MNNNILLQKVVDNNTDFIISKISEMASNKQISNAFSDKNKKIGRTQLSKLLSAIQSANSVEEIKLFIKYQESRSRGDGWNQDIGGKTVADVVISKLDDISNEAIKISKNHLELETSKLKLRMAEKFLGYLYWQGTVWAKAGDK